MNRGFMDKYICVSPEQNPEETMLLETFGKNELKHKMFRPIVSKSNPNTQQFYNSLITSLVPLDYTSLSSQLLNFL